MIHFVLQQDNDVQSCSLISYSRGLINYLEWKRNDIVLVSSLTSFLFSSRVQEKRRREERRGRQILIILYRSSFCLHFHPLSSLASQSHAPLMSS